MTHRKPDRELWPRIRTACLPVILRFLRRLPPPALDWLLGSASIVVGMLRPVRRRGALAWAAVHVDERRGRWRLAVSLLRHRGRTFAMATLPALEDLGVYRRRVTVEGIARIAEAAARGGAILLAFHVGPGSARVILETLGYPVTYLGSGAMFGKYPRPRVTWAPIVARRPPGIVLADPRTRVAGLYRARRVLLDGGMVIVAADSGSGPILLRIPVLGTDVPLYRGWFALRRQTGASTLPVLTHWVGTRVVLTVHPPLPPPDADPARDLRSCEAVLAELLTDYARRFPEQCHGFALARS